MPGVPSDPAHIDNLTPPLKIHSHTCDVVVCNVEIANASSQLHVPRTHQKTGGHRGHQEVESWSVTPTQLMMLIKYDGNLQINIR